MFYLSKGYIGDHVQTRAEGTPSNSVPRVGDTQGRVEDTQGHAKHEKCQRRANFQTEVSPKWDYLPIKCIHESLSGDDESRVL